MNSGGGKQRGGETQAVMEMSFPGGRKPARPGVSWTSSTAVTVTGSSQSYALYLESLGERAPEFPFSLPSML